MSAKHFIIHLPFIGPIIRRLYNWLMPFSSSADYWNKRYEKGGNSGRGSYDNLAEFKADFLNSFILNQDISSIIEYGCGDGNQLTLAQYPQYIGFDISQHAVNHCKSRFQYDPTKTFKQVSDYNNESAELTLSLDVVYHLTEDNVFFEYMKRLFDSSQKYVVIYSSNFDEAEKETALHVRHRKFSTWVDIEKPDWSLISHIPNKYPFDKRNNTGSFADFYVYEKKQLLK